MTSLDRIELPPIATVYADPPWQFRRSTGKVSPEHRRLYRYATMPLDAIRALPVERLCRDNAQCYLWSPCSFVPLALTVLDAWGFRYATMMVWIKTTKHGSVDPRGMGWYYRTACEICLVGIRGTCRTLSPARRTSNVITAPTKGHSTKPERMYEILEACTEAPRLELFARTRRAGWHQWGDELA